MKQGWFEFSSGGWRKLSAARPLGRLLLEAVQNSFDARAARVSVNLASSVVIVEDDADAGFADARLAYTVYLTDKDDAPGLRGRMGRGLKELIGAMDAATVELVGHTLRFTDEGRIAEPNHRKVGTRISLQRAFAPEDLREAGQLLRICIPPAGTTLKVNGKAVRMPKREFALSSSELDTVVIVDGKERISRARTPLSLYTPRKGGSAYVLEMGVPIEAWDAPWHVDIGQRLPLSERRDHVPSRFKLQLKGLLLEAMLPSHLERVDLKQDWVLDAIARCPLRSEVLDTYVSKVFPRGAVLEGTIRANDRARQLGAHVIESRSMPYRAFVSLGRVLDSADDYVRRRAAEFAGDDVEPSAEQKRFAESVRWLARRLTGQAVQVRFFDRDPTDDGLLEDAVTDVDAHTIAFNIKGPLRFDDVLDPFTFGVVLHELAHLGRNPEHDSRFIDCLQQLAGASARLLGDGGPTFAEALRQGDPDKRTK